MKKEITVETTVGKFTIVKPKAGKRNRAVLQAETDQGFIKFAAFKVYLLPECINSRPEGFDKDVSIEHVLNELEIEDYDKLTDALETLMEPKSSTSDDKKKA